jgi:AcrR family transcriptional regulator
VSNKTESPIRSRSRLHPGVRRKHLLRVGAELFATRPYDEVQIEDVARRAGVSRGLLYHYFGSKRDFFAAIVEGGAKELARVTKPDPDLPPLDRLRASLDAYLDYVERYEHSYLAIHRGGVSADRRIRAVVERNRRHFERRTLEAITGGAEPSPAGRLAVRGWHAFLVTVCLDWLERRRPDRAVVRELCVRTLVGAVLAAAEAQAGGEE